MMKSPRKLALVFLFCILAARGFSQETGSALKFDFFSPVGGCLGFTYERAHSNFVSFDYEAGFIGLKLDDYFEYDTFIGGYVSFGPRLYVKQDNTQLTDMQGVYIKPAAMVNYYQYTSNYQVSSYYQETSGFDLSTNLELALGSQWVLHGVLVIDLWFGLGYTYEWKGTIGKQDNAPELIFDSYQPFKFNFVNLSDSPFLIDGGLNIGIKF